MEKNNIHQYAIKNVIDTVSELERYGYSVEVMICYEINKIIRVTTTHKDVNMPDIKILPNYDDQYLYLTPTLEFPTLTWHEGDFADTIAYYLDQWQKLGNTITAINNYVFDFSKWKYDEETDEWYYI